MVRYLALTAMDDGFTGIAHFVGWNDNKHAPEPKDLKLFAPALSDRRRAALELLTKMMAWYRVGQTRPLPFFPRMSLAYANVLAGHVGKSHTVETALDKARKEWRFWFAEQRHGEGSDAHLALVWGDDPPVDSLNTLLGDVLPDGCDFESLAKAIWLPFLQSETKENDS